jgi:predicted Zn-dependent protease
MQHFKFMSTTSRVRQFIRQPRTATIFLLLAAISWASIWWWQARYAPVNQHIEAGRQHLQTGRGVDAEHEWRQAVALDPDNATAWELLGDYYSGAASWPAALEAYRHVTRIKPETPQIYSRLANTAVHVGDMQAAQELAQRALQHDPDDVDALYILVNLLAGSQLDDQLQLEYLRRLIKLKPDNVEYLARTADLLILERRYAEAKPLVEKILQLDSDFAPAYAMRGTIALQGESSAEAWKVAESSFKKVLDFTPGDQLSRRFLARSYLRQGKTAQAIAELEQVDRSLPRDKSYLQELASAYQKARKLDKAAEVRRRYADFDKQKSEINRLEALVSQDPTNFESTLKLVHMLLRTDDPEGAEKYLNQALKLHPNDARAIATSRELERLYVQHLHDARMFLSKGDVEKAGWHLGLAYILRPFDQRTQIAVQQLSNASGGQLPQSFKDLGRTKKR